MSKNRDTHKVNPNMRKGHPDGSMEVMIPEIDEIVKFHIHQFTWSSITAYGGKKC